MKLTLYQNSGHSVTYNVGEQWVVFSIKEIVSDDVHQLTGGDYTKNKERRQ